MKKVVEYLKKHPFLVVCVLFLLLKLWIIHIQPISVRNTDHDDGMFVREAVSLLKGKWLGKYNDTTLSKGIFGIVFIAFARVMPVDYLTFLQIFYFLACLSIVHMLSNVVKNKGVLLLCYLVCLFNPISYSDAFSYVYRDGVYAALILFFIAFSFEIFFHYRDLKKVRLYSGLFAITYAAIYFCREETAWLTPYIVVAGTITCLFILLDRECVDKAKKMLSMVALPAGAVVLVTLAVSFLNYHYYGRFVVNDYTSRDFKDAYGALTRVKQENYIKRVPLNKETREKLYSLSPKFKELEPYLEGSSVDKYRYIQNDIQDGFLYWGLRIAVKEAGYYQNAATARDYYIALAKEINELCDSGQIEALPRRSSLIAPFYESLTEELIRYIPAAFVTQATYNHVNVRIPLRVEDPSKYTTYHKLTGNRLTYDEGDLDSVNMKIMEGLLRLYAWINPVLLIVSLLSYAVMMVLFFAKKLYATHYKQIILLNGLLAIYLIRVLVIGYIAATEYESAIMKCHYLSCSYVVQSIFSMLALICAADWFRQKRRKINEPAG